MDFSHISFKRNILRRTNANTTRMYLVVLIASIHEMFESIFAPRIQSPIVTTRTNYHFVIPPTLPIVTLHSCIGIIIVT